MFEPLRCPPLETKWNPYLDPDQQNVAKVMGHHSMVPFHSVGSPQRRQKGEVSLVAWMKQGAMSGRPMRESHPKDHGGLGSTV